MGDPVDGLVDVVDVVLQIRVVLRAQLVQTELGDALENVLLAALEQLQS